MTTKVPMPQAPIVDIATGYTTRPWNNFFNSLSGSVNTTAAGSIATPAAGGLQGGGIVADGLSLSIATNGVSGTMFRQSAAYSVVGRAFGTAGNVADITATANNRVLARIGNVLAFWDLTLVPSTVADGDYGDITVSGVGTAWAIDPNVVSNAKFRQSTALTVVGRSAATTGNVADIAGAASQFLGINAAGTVLGFQTLAGDATLSGPTITLATVNANIGTWGSATQAGVITLDAKGRATGASNVTITPAASSITGGATLSRVSDTNVVLTLGGAPTTALLAATSITVTWSGTLAASRGGTGVGALGDITRTSDTNVTLTLGGTPLGAVVTSTSFTLGWTGTLAVSRGGLGVGTITGLMQGNGTSAVTGITDSSTTGQVLRVTGASTYAWGALSLSTAASITGTLPVGNGGTGITAFGTGVATALGINVGSAGAFVTFNGALGTPLSGILTNCTFPTLNQNTSGSAATLTTPRAIYGNNFDGSAALAQIIASTYGGTGNGFAKLSGPATSEKTFTLPNASDTIACLGQAQAFTALQTFNAGWAMPNNSALFITVPRYTVGFPNSYINADSTSTLLILQSPAQTGVVTISDTAVTVTSSTTASAANVNQASSGSALLRVTSSLRYKQDIHNLSDAHADLVLSLRPITYRSKAEADDPNRVHWGFVAEEAHRILPELVNYDAAGRPDGFQYERVIVGLLSVVKRLEARVAKLEALRATSV